MTGQSFLQMNAPEQGALLFVSCHLQNKTPSLSVNSIV